MSMKSENKIRLAQRTTERFITVIPDIDEETINDRKIVEEFKMEEKISGQERRGEITEEDTKTRSE